MVLETGLCDFHLMILTVVFDTSQFSKEKEILQLGHFTKLFIWN